MKSHLIPVLNPLLSPIKQVCVVIFPCPWAENHFGVFWPCQSLLHTATLVAPLWMCSSQGYIGGGRSSGEHNRQHWSAVGRELQLPRKTPARAGMQGTLPQKNTRAGCVVLARWEETCSCRGNSYREGGISAEECRVGHTVVARFAEVCCERRLGDKATVQRATCRRARRWGTLLAS